MPALLSRSTNMVISFSTLILDVLVVVNHFCALVARDVYLSSYFVRFFVLAYAVLCQYDENIVNN